MKRGRKKIPKAKPLRIKERDNWICQICGKDLSEAGDWHQTMDHVKEVAIGGTDDEDNLMLACRRCNMIKSKEFNKTFIHKS